MIKKAFGMSLLIATSVLLSVCEAERPEGYLVPVESVIEGSAVAPVLSPETLECPSENVITTRYRCKVRTYVYGRNMVAYASIIYPVV